MDRIGRGSRADNKVPGCQSANEGTVPEHMGHLNILPSSREMSFDRVTFMVVSNRWMKERENERNTNTKKYKILKFTLNLIRKYKV